MHVRLTDRSRNPVDALLISDVSYDQIAQADDGRLALHSLPDAETFYEELSFDGKRHFTSIGQGVPEYEDLNYYEGASKQEREGGRYEPV